MESCPSSPLLTAYPLASPPAALLSWKPLLYRKLTVLGRITSFALRTVVRPSHSQVRVSPSAVLHPDSTFVNRHSRCVAPCVSRERNRATMVPDHLYDPEIVATIVVGVCRRYHFNDDVTADFRQDVHLKIIEDDYARLRQFEGRSSLKTFLHVMVQRMAMDYLIREKGKWHASASAKRLGPAAMELETLMYRDQHPRQEAIQIMLSRSEHALSENELRSMARRLPPRTFGRTESDEDTDALPHSGGADVRVLDEEREKRKATARAKLSQALAELDPEDGLILKMRYWDGIAVVRIAEIVGMGNRPHDRVARILKRLKSMLNEAGVEIDDVRELLHE